MNGLHCWWEGLSGESRAAIIAAAVGPVVAEILGVRRKMVRSFYINTLEKLEAAETRLYSDHELRERAGTRYGTSVFPMEQVAKKAKISMFRAKLATKWNERNQKYGNA